MFKTFLSTIIIVTILICAGCCVWHFLVSPPQPPPPPPPPPVSHTSVEEGKDMLTSLANAAIMFSIKHGGNGETNFPAEDKELFSYIPDVYRKARFDTDGASKHIGGYYWQMQAPKNANDFYFQLLVASGFEGEELYIQKDMVIHDRNANKPVEKSGTQEEAKTETQIQQPHESQEPKPQIPPKETQEIQNSAEQKDTTISNLKDKISEGVGRAGQSLKSAGRTVTQKISDLVDEVSAPKPEPEPVIQDADENEAKRLLESFSNGATLYSIKNGGNGKDHFPVSPEQFERFVPKIYYMALVKNNDVASANPAGGYIVKYMPNGDGTHFKFRAFPSQVKYYRGKSFVMTDNMEITPEQK